MLPNVAFVFPGQGSQRTGMLDPFIGSPEADDLISLASSLSGLDLATIATAGPDGALADTRAAQPLLFIAGWLWSRRLTDAGIRPSACAGHSLGELIALTVAGVADVETMLRLVCRRAQIMAEVAQATPGTMAAVIGMDSAVVTALVEPLNGVWVANDNAPGQIVLSGTHAGIEEATRALSEAGARKIVPLHVAGPFHSPLMAPAAESFAAVLDAVSFADATLPVVQNTTATASTSGAELRERLAGQIPAPVRWTETMGVLKDRGVSIVLESGPGAVLTGLARRVDGLTGYPVESTHIERIREEVGA